MKQLYQKLITASILALMSTHALAYDCEVDGIYYILGEDRQSNKVAHVTYKDNNYNSYSGTIRIPSSITYKNETYKVISILSHAFFDCTEPTSVTIENGVEWFSSNAFRDCTGLTSITIPNSVFSIGEEAFTGCTGLTSVTIPNSVTRIETSTFTGCSGLTSVTIPESVEEIGSFAFSNCSSLTSVTIPNSVTSIESGAFFDCSALSSITIPNSVTSIEESVFFRCTGLTSITIPNNVTTIRHGAFSYCSGLTTATIPNSVTYIGDAAFSNCTGLTSITIPNSVTSIDSSAFYGCTGLTSITIPNSVTSIGKSAFYDCTGLTSITIPNSVTKIGDYAFSGCSALTSIIVDKENPIYNDGDGSNCIIESASNTLITGICNTIIPSTVTSIGIGAFYRCTGLTSITIPNSVTSIGSSAFSGCTGLTSITIPDGVTSIGWSVFCGCTGLTSITIPNSVSNIGGSAFEGCTGLTSITIPNGVKNIELWAFRNCSGLSSITIPNSVIDIYGGAFDGCNCMVICNNETPPTAYSSTFNSDMTAIVPFSAIETYRNAEGWNVMKIIANASIDVTATAGPSNMTVTGGYGNTDITVKEFGFEGYEPFEDVIELYGLDPDTEYTFTFYVESEEGGRQTQDFTFKTDKLTMTMMDPKTVKLGEVVVAAQTNLDDKETNVGFEWRREDWGDKFRPKNGGGIIYQGTIEGSIRDLNTDKLWLVKPYYLSNSGTYHYGEEIGIDPSDVSYFDPVVHTADNAEVSGNSATVQGYVINGSDQVTSQGMEYWKEMDGQSQSTTVETAGGQVMSTNLTNLDYETTYDYVAFATTTSGQTYYGEVKKFKTGKKTSDSKGDVNSDGKVDISDIVAVINHIAGTNSYKQADVNGDTKVDISDIVAIINIIAGN